MFVVSATINKQTTPTTFTQCRGTPEFICVPIYADMRDFCDVTTTTHIAGAAAPKGPDDIANIDKDGVKLYLGNLPFTTTEQDVQEYFGKFGNLLDIFLPKDRNTGRPRGA